MASIGLVGNLAAFIWRYPPIRSSIYDSWGANFSRYSMLSLGMACTFVGCCVPDRPVRSGLLAVKIRAAS